MKGEGMDKMREALAELVACHTEEAGLTMSMVANRADFDEFMERCQRRLAAALAAAREALSVQPAEPVALIAAAVERVRNTIIVEGESPEKLREAIALRVADMGKQTFALPQPAPSVPAVPEFCCEHAWSAAKQLAWKERDLSCDCDHNEYCQKCFPLEFRAGGKWDKYAAAPHPAAKGGAE